VLAFQPLTYLVRRKVILRAQKKREDFPNLLVIGITGSYGKSSTKEFLYEILSEKYKVLKTQRNINAEIGVAQTILKELKPEHQIFVAEIGAYERGKIEEVCKMIKPKIGILTGINEQHMATFGSQENIIKAKFELIDSLPRDGTAILNMNNKYIKDRIMNHALSAIIKTGVDIWAEDIKVEKEFILFKIKTKDGDSADFRINLMGRQNLENILLAVGCAKKLGMNLNEISAVCWKINSAQGGIKFLKREQPMVLDASYSANPDGVIADLEYLKLYQGKKLIIMPCLIELGKASKEVHQKIGRKIAEVCDLAIITTKDYFKEIKEQAPNVFFIENPEEIAEKIKDFDVVLLEGRVPQKLIDLLK
jgi:UDP-N-acetylmuramoyl-tripeptide--D-alanyl-D-alanine ligase